MPEPAKATTDLNPGFATSSIGIEGGGVVYTSFKADAAVPTDATTKMSALADFVSLGELSENGFTDSRSISTTDHKGYHGTIVMTTVDDDTTKIKVEFLEVNRPAVAKLRYGNDSVTETAGKITAIKRKPYKGEKHPFVLQELMSDTRLHRIVVEKGVITSFDDVPHKRGDLMVYGMEITANTPDDGSEVVKEYFAELA